MKNQYVQTIETAAYFEPKPLQIIPAQKRSLPQQVVKQRRRKISICEEPLPYLKPLKQNNHIKLQQLLAFPILGPPNPRPKDQPLKLRRYSHYDFISKTDRSLRGACSQLQSRTMI